MQRGRSVVVYDVSTLESSPYTVTLATSGPGVVVAGGGDDTMLRLMTLGEPDSSVKVRVTADVCGVVADSAEMLDASSDASEEAAEARDMFGGVDVVVVIFRRIGCVMVLGRRRWRV